jgi:hypothetical protein
MSRWQRFARALASRFAARALVMPPAALVFARRAERWTARLRVHARLALACTERRVERRVELHARTTSRAQGATTVMNRFLARPGSSGALAIVLGRVERLRERIEGRGTRRNAERVANPPASAPAAPAAVLPPQRVPAITVMRGGMQAREPTRPFTREQVTQASTSAIAQAASAASRAAAEQPARSEDVGALADEVLRRIDRRIAAQRERYGRA